MLPTTLFFLCYPTSSHGCCTSLFIVDLQTSTFLPCPKANATSMCQCIGRCNLIRCQILSCLICHCPFLQLLLPTIILIFHILAFYSIRWNMLNLHIELHKQHIQTVSKRPDILMWGMVRDRKRAAPVCPKTR